VTPARSRPGFIERLLSAVDRVPHRIALDVAGEPSPITYAELLASIERLSGQLTSLGVERGDRVVVMLPSGPELVAAVYGLASLGAVAVPLSDSSTIHELGPMLDRVKATLAIAATSRALSLLSAHASPPRVLWASEHPPPAPAPPGHALRIVHAATLSAAPRALVAPPADSIVGCHFTYKGVGRALGALHRYASYGACLDGLLAHYGERAGGDHLVVLPMHPVYGLLTTMMAPLSLGATIRLVRLGPGAELLAALVQHEVRFACLVPPLLASLAAAARKNGDLARRTHPELVLASGGSVLGGDVAAAVADAMGLEILEGYGTTESLPVTASRVASHRRGTLGLPLTDDVRVAVLDHAGAPAAAGQSGAIAIGGPTLMAGYLDEPEATERFLSGGLFHTGDLGRLDPDGQLVFEGRSLPFAKSVAQMVDLRELEDVARLHPAIADARAVGMLDPRLGECVDLTVRAKGSDALSGKDVTAHLRAYLSSHKIPRRVRVVASAPAAAGKRGDRA
jgi:acyl-CoA synthetase (AMP-forming)/AMP-acid ligase II